MSELDVPCKYCDGTRHLERHRSWRADWRASKWPRGSRARPFFTRPTWDVTPTARRTLREVSPDRQEMEVLFTFLAERYERRSVRISSHLVFSKGDQVFKDPMTTMAAIDRLVHHAVILEFDNESIRAKEAKAKSRT